MFMVHTIVRRDILPRIKFASFSKEFQEPAGRVFEKPNNPYYNPSKLGMDFRIFLCEACNLLIFL